MTTSPSRTRFGLLAYGPSGRLHREGSVAILTVQAHAPAGSEIVVLTDRPWLYRWLAGSTTVDRLSSRILTQWRGPTGDRYRPKIEALRHLAADASADVALVDADTMATRDLTPMTARLASGALMLHRREYLLAAPPRRGDRSLAHEILGRPWEGIVPDRTASMWNGGIIASARSHHGIFDRCLAVFDRMRLETRHFAVEQLTYSIVFPAYGPVEEASPWFDHYWANRPWFDRRIERFLSTVQICGLTPSDAAAQLARHPIAGALDGRVPWWMARLQRLVTPPDPDDDEISEFGEG